MANQEKSLIQMYVSKLLSNQIDYLDSQLVGIQQGGSDEFIHHTRVMSRRMRATIEVFSSYLPKKKAKIWLFHLRNLTRSLTKIRDLDVQIIFLENMISKIENQHFIQGVSRVLLRKKQKRDSYNTLANRTVEEFMIAKTNSEIHEFVQANHFQDETFYPTQKLSEIAITHIEEGMKNCFSYAPFITNPDNIKQLHNLRIAFKNLRYSVELFQDIYPSLTQFLDIMKQFQDELGKIHDCDVWLVDLARFGVKELKKIEAFYGQTGPYNFIKPGLDYLIAEIQLTRNDTYNIFIQHWNEQFQRQFWTRLREQFVQFPAYELIEEQKLELIIPD